MNPIVRLVEPTPESQPLKLNPVDWLSGLVAAAVKSGLIAAVLAGLQEIDLTHVGPVQAFGVGFAGLACTTLLRLYGSGKPETAKKPVSDTDEFNAPTLGGGY